ncbi:MAG: iron uptake porin, partial [Cyanobacteria bacterium J06555_13]
MSKSSVGFVFKLLLGFGLLSGSTLLGMPARAADATESSAEVSSTLQLDDLRGKTDATTAVLVENETSSETSTEIAQVTSVSELSDVQPGDWAFTALQRLVEEYGCLEGYPDNTFRGNRALTRYEFAAGLNACLDVVLQLIGDGDLEELRRLQEEFAAELAVVRSQVDNLESDVAELEANQFSTTTKFSAQ